MIDTFYDNKVRVLFSAEAPPKSLFNFQSKKPDEPELDDEHRMILDDLQISPGSNDAKAASSMFSGEEEMFAFDRTISRMHEMQTDDYWNRREIY
jgi:protein AFG1